MWISKKKWDSVNKRISVLEQAEQERIDRKKLLEERKIWYLCDGEKKDCKKALCYKKDNEGPCRHTTDIEHALNFQKEKHGSRTRYWEKSMSFEDKQKAG